MEYVTDKEFDTTGEPEPLESLELSGLLREYYQNRTVRGRMWELFGGGDPHKATAAYIVGNDGFSEFGQRSSPACLSDCLEAGLEIDRSLWDQVSLIADIDLEYHNFDYRWLPG